MRALFKLILLLVFLAVAFVAGLMSSNIGIFALLTGNVRTNVDFASVLTSVEALSQLTTTRFTYSNIITASRDLPPILAVAFGEELTINAVGHVNAGIDLSELEENDIRQDGDILFINLPAPELQDCFFSEQASRIENERSALFANYPEDLQIEARRLAIRYFREKAIEDGIFEEARIQSEIVISEFVQAVAPQIETVRVATDPIDTSRPLPATCQ